ncbi:LLM class flavin-dependent oxidoreductase [Rhodococcus sp. ARC_M6]|uniref:LLM class flavin-dependent oxidoreductase n=1 Tax=Rhodococcus sp. ARC_M6 TaxID=2928852 RepID=UPI001FB552B7|nr:LLM class flavin-dependent oxidoreductase [Rhodococcus sp. ARC_M6]MCJ0902252.1 LLM class flavin-dependent oxidoreductase [Rhodococcus sp. ARC_M6]
MTIPLSILDLAPISEGGTARQALRNSLDLARSAEAWGYRRYWVAEHHFAGVASSSPAVLVGLIAAATNTIRVGSAAVLLGNNTAAEVVEAFGTVEALYPGRIDLGIGRSGQRRVEALKAVASEKVASERVRRDTVVREGVVIPAPFDPTGLLTSPLLQASFEALAFSGAQVPDFDEQVDDILSLLSGTFRSRDGVELHASPGEGADLELWVFGSSAGPSAELAGRLGLPFGANYHVAPSSTVEAVEAYRGAFRPSSTLSKPYVVVSADVVAAEDDATARELASTFGHWAHSIRSGHGAIPYPDPATALPLTPQQHAVVEDRLITQFVGSPSTVADRLDSLQKLTGADELVISGVTHRHEDRVRSYELLAREWGLTALLAA